MFKKSTLFLFLLYTSLHIFINSEDLVIVYPVDNKIKQYCNNNVYNFEFQVKFSQKFENIIPFEMIIPLPNRLPFKCVLDGPNTRILCFHSFSNYVWSLSDNSRVEMPYSFPYIEGIRWDYDSFLTKIYRYLWRSVGNCGLEFENMNLDNSANNQITNELKSESGKNEIVLNIDDLYGGQCHSSRYDYTFNMKVKLNNGEIVEELKSAKNDKKNMKIKFLHNIYVPILLGEKKRKGTTSFRKDYEYKYATCIYDSEISQEDFDNVDGIIFQCNLIVNRYIRFQGPLQIKPFTDNVYISKTGVDGKISTKNIGIKFEISSSTDMSGTGKEEEGGSNEENKNNEQQNTEESESEEEEIEEIKPIIENTEPVTKPEEQKETEKPEEPEEPEESKTAEQPTPEVEESKPAEEPAPKVEESKPAEEPTPKVEESKPVESKTNLRRMDNVKKEPNFLILDSKLNIFICPDKPILTVNTYDEGIGFGGINTSGSKYLFLIYGFLSNGYDSANDTLTLLDMTKDEIKFYLKVTDNLEAPDNKKKTVKCTIPSGSSINKNVLVEVKCIGTRAQLGNNDTDLILNWKSEENNDFENIVIRWPYDLTKRKHIFFYKIQGLSVKKEDYGCFENKFFFYLYVYDLNAQPKISFNLPLVYPKNTEAVCKLYNSVTFKCVIDLRLKKISKGSKIILPHDFREYLLNKEQNIVLYIVDNTTSSSELDFTLPVEENCGDFMLVGALKDVGYSYLQVVFIIIGSFVGFLICVFGIAFCIIYEITHKNRKGPYFKHAEEKELPNTSNVSQNQTKP